MLQGRQHTLLRVGPAAVQEELLAGQALLAALTKKGGVGGGHRVVSLLRLY